MTHIACQIIEPGEPSLVAQRLHRLRDASLLQGRGSCRTLRVMRSSSFGLGGKFEMDPQFLFELAIQSVPTNASPEANQPFAQGSHGATFSLLRSAFMIAVICSHSAFSVVSWRRPAAVMP